MIQNAQTTTEIEVARTREALQTKLADSKRELERKESALQKASDFEQKKLKDKLRAKSRICEPN